MYPYTHVRTEGGRESLTVFTPSGAPIVATGEHPHFAELLAGAQSDTPIDDLRALVDLSNAVAQHFDTLSERVSVANGRVFFDGDEVDSTITTQIKRCLDDPSIGDWKPLVLFMENVAANPNEHSREQLFDWLRHRDFTIASNGCFIAYKGVYTRDEDADDTFPYQSSSRGSAIVNGERYEGAIPNGVGATVEMPRSDVQHDPGHGCSTGLHVGTYEYAKGYARGALLTVLVNPRDVVSVPTDCEASKMRVCRYVVSDDEPTPPSESAAITYAEEVDGETEIIEHGGVQYEVIETRPPVKGDLYWNDFVEGACAANFDHDEDAKILCEVEPESAEAEDREPARLYLPIPNATASEYDGKDYFVSTGDRREPNSEFYLFDGFALYGYVGGGIEEILVPTEPQHGDEKVEDGDVYFYLDCPEAKFDSPDAGPRWVPADGDDREDFLSAHEECFA